MDFIKIPLCACTLDRCKKKTHVIGDYFNQSVQTDICFDRNKAFTNIEVGKGEVYDKHSISTSVELEKSKVILDSESKTSESHLSLSATKDSLLEKDHKGSKDRELYIVTEEREDSAKEVESKEDIQSLSPASSQQELKEDLTEEIKTQDNGSAVLEVPVGEVPTSEDFEQVKVKGSIRSVGSRSTTTSKTGTQKIFENKAHPTRKKLTASNRGADSHSLKIRKLPSILLPRNERCCNWPLSIEKWQCTGHASTDCIWTNHISPSACSSCIQSCRISHPMQCESENCTRGLYRRIECRENIQQCCNQLYNRMNNVNCYKLLQHPQCLPQLSQNPDVLTKPSSGICNMHGIRVCRPPCLQPRREFQDCRVHLAQVKNSYGCANMRYRNYYGCNNLHPIFTPHRMYCTYRHTMLPPTNMYVYTFSS